jgi:hypothetical protein
MIYSPKKNSSKVIVIVLVVLLSLFALALAIEYTRGIIYARNFKKFQKQGYYTKYIKNTDDFINDGNGILYKYATCSITNPKDLEYHKLKSDVGFWADWHTSYLEHRSPLIDGNNDVIKNMPPSYKKNILSFIDSSSLNNAIQKRQSTIDLTTSINHLFKNSEKYYDFCDAFYDRAFTADTTMASAAMSYFKSVPAPKELEPIKQNTLSTLSDLTKIHFDQLGSNPEYWAAQDQMDKHVTELGNAMQGKITPSSSQINGMLSSLKN